MNVSLDHLSWTWIVLALTVPSLVALLAAWPFWRHTEMIFGNIVGTAVLFASGFGLIWREYVAIDRLVRHCFDSGGFCWPVPSAFTRFAIYGFIALFEVFGLFALSLIVERRRRERDYSPEWR
ncbi:MAG: hypothetical protein A3H96_01480 [Acidobacteria bacterium RIFCSPLOWO2_02_FULL_67_36]|nr:MAG: hypothetical protein A3H96_01480 [Acidobacteria bacterium RIFCSPLOWO2_02_FULL_67_36]OFW26215.1 MAG: hypothetical protein A3G21_20775 [Acidobacteria bacterium RIFCSPLOWO2_12_FULL_66_21]